MSISDSVQRAIHDQLPSVIAGELKAYLQKAKENELKVVNLEKELNGKTKEYSALEIKYNELTKRLEKFTALEKREPEILAKEIRLETEMLKVKLEESYKRADSIKELVSLVFRNPRYITNTKVEKDCNPNYNYGNNKNFDFTNTEEGIE